MTEQSEMYRQIDEVIEQQIKAQGLPGLALAITDRDGLLHRQTYGYASLEAGTPLGTKHVFEWGSIGKSFTCILLLQLVERGLIDLHQPVDELLPWFEVQSEFAPITLHHLMTHTAGIIRGTDFPADPRYEVWALRHTRAVNPPGEHFHYSNVAYKALGLVIEAVTGRTYQNLIQERILDPLGMGNSTPAITHSLRRDLATGYQHFYDDRPWLREHGLAPATWLETDTADGCLAGTADDLAAYLRMLMNGGSGPEGSILSPASFQALTGRHVPLDDPESAAYGYGLYGFEEDGHSFLSHGGGMVGYASSIIADLTKGVGIVTLVNGPFSQRTVVKFVFDAMQAGCQGLPLPAPESPPNRTADADAASFASVYYSNSDDFRVTASGDQLNLDWGNERAPLHPHGEDTFLVDHPDFERYPLRFRRDDCGAISSVVHGERVWHVQQAKPAASDLLDEWQAFPGHYRSHNPWLTNFRIIRREGTLFFVSPDGDEEPLTLREDGVFRVGDDHSPEFIRFDTIVDGQAWHANYSGCDFYRFFTP